MRRRKPLSFKAKNRRVVSRERAVARVEAPRAPRVSNISVPLYIHSGGGCGDLIYHYFKSDSWRYLSSVKAMHPNTKVCAVITCHHPNVAELVKTNPYIDSVFYYSWYPPGHDLEYGWKGSVDGEDLAEWARGRKVPLAANKVYLTSSERSSLERICTDKYIVMHPFAGLPDRSCHPHPLDGKYRCYPDYKYIQTANYLAERGYLVKIVGRSSNDAPERMRAKTESLVPANGESFHPNVQVLIDGFSLRQNVELVRNANGFIGTHSSMLSAAWTNNVPSVFFYPGWDDDGNRHSVGDHGGTTGTWAIDRPWNDYFELKAQEFLALDPAIPGNRLLDLMGR